MAFIKVYLTDKDIEYENVPRHFLTIKNWAHEHCPSFTGVDIVDVSDTSVQYDHIAEFTFGTEKDANWFKLKWM